jgi:hypothetical protein
MKGQINLEFLASALVYLLALGVVLTVSSEILPNFDDSSEKASLNTEAYEVTTKMLTEPGYSTASGGTTDWDQTASTVNSVSAFGLTNNSEEFLQVERNKIQALESFTPYSPSGKINYSDFKRITGAENQFLFNFTWKPIVDTSDSFIRGNDSEMKSPIAYYRMEETSGDIKDYSNQSMTASNNGAERGVDGALKSRGFFFDGSNSEYFSSNSNIDIPQNYSIFVWIKGNMSDQGGGNIYPIGIHRGAALSVKQGGKDTDTGVIVREKGTTLYHTILADFNVLDGEWHHLGATVNRVDKTAKIYVDGELLKKGSFPDHAQLNEDLVVGSISPFWGYYTGKLDEARFYRTDLGGKQVKKYYRNRMKYHMREPETDYFKNSGNRVRYGMDKLNGKRYYFLNIEHNGGFNSTYVSRGWNFTDRTPLAEKDSFNIYGNKFTVEDIQNRERDQGSLVALSNHLKTFGPNVDSDSSVVRIDRFATMEEEPLHLKVLTW